MGAWRERFHLDCVFWATESREGNRTGFLFFWVELLGVWINLEWSQPDNHPRGSSDVGIRTLIVGRRLYGEQLDADAEHGTWALGT